MLLSNSISIIPWAPQTPSSLLSPLCFSSKIERKCLLKQVKLSSGFNSERSERTLPVCCSPSQAAGEDNRDNPAHQDGMNFWRKWQLCIAM
ncbi:hypothetical protein AMTR_s00048p00194210 [Amborella trichopoda]|uniref:Uncharacterized protein n=1 Tax=Amborella trichopoda TaxID=13333 RepID=U5D5M1_AMBTC|nr:hypothetical protein AMTR_s00048p00194210 [Amborella trichopoda]